MIRPIAIHLPQFHPIPENDAWWGKGFTEWTNVTKAKPLFQGHYQPHLPADLGFYDLRLEDARIAQAALAKQYGIYGFCYYHYWFNGKRLLERPVEEILTSGKPDFPFMFCWANENWSRIWDGSADDVLIQQEYSEQDAVLHCEALLPYFKDKRYIKIYNKPVFAIYKADLIPDLAGYIHAFRKTAAENNIELYLCAVEAYTKPETNLLIQNFEAVIEFQPHSEYLQSFMQLNFENKLKAQQAKQKGFFFKFKKNRLTENVLHEIKYRIDYAEYVNFVLSNHTYPKNYNRFPGVTPMWDNTARRGEKAFMLTNENPAKYKEWLAYHKKNFKPFSAEENLLFINAWNEWAEGNHLEPCQKWGRTYLEFTKEALKDLQ